MRLAGSYGDDSQLATAINPALAGSYARVVIAFDGVDFLAEEAAHVLERAVRTARVAGIELVLEAERPGPQRWLRRHGLAVQARTPDGGPASLARGRVAGEDHDDSGGEP